MRIIQNSTQHQTQKLAVTKQLQQAIHILGLSHLELGLYLQQIVLENPLLEMENSQSLQQDNTSQSIQSAEYDNKEWDRNAIATSNDREHIDQFSYIPSRDKTLRQSISEQINCQIQDPKQKIIANLLLQHLDSAGYLNSDYTEIANFLQCSADEINAVVIKLQELEPAGMFARNLSECIKLQLQFNELYSNKAQIILDNLQSIVAGQYKALLKQNNISSEEFTEIWQLIKQQNPKPGWDDGDRGVHGILPDAYLNRVEQEFEITLNNQMLPKILFNNEYRARIDMMDSDKHTQKYVKNCISQGNFLIAALQQRADTLLSVCTQIVQEQKQFFQYGINYLKPMTLAHIEQKLSLHESTISRVTSNKFIQTPYGMFELKYFFTSKLNVSNSRKFLSSTTIRARLKSLINSEDKFKPLSDDELVQILNQQGIQIARRTVTKYRKLENIASSYDRKHTAIHNGVAKKIQSEQNLLCL